jgi:[protein-PII] uridylyltransferase
VLASSRLTVKSALVRTVTENVEGAIGLRPALRAATAGCTGHLPGIAVDTWWVDCGSREMPTGATLETALRRLGEGDQSILEKLQRRDAGYRPAYGTSGRPRVVLIPGASADATVLEVRAADRPGLLNAIGNALAERGVDLRSAHIATHAGQAVDVLYVSEPSGGVLSPPRVAATISALVDAGTLIGAPVE